MIRLTLHNPWRALRKAFYALEGSETVTVDAALDSLEAVIHNATRLSRQLSELYPDEIDARLARQLRKGKADNATGVM